MQLRQLTLGALVAIAMAAPAAAQDAGSAIAAASKAMAAEPRIRVHGRRTSVTPRSTSDAWRAPAQTIGARLIKFSWAFDF